MTPTDTGDLSHEETQKIRSMTFGGFWPGLSDHSAWWERPDIREDEVKTAYQTALDRILPPGVRFLLPEIRDPRAGPGRPSPLALHRRRHARCQVYIRLGFAAIEILCPLPMQDRNLWKRERRSRLAGVRSLEAIAPDIAASLKQSEALHEKHRQLQGRSYPAPAIDEFCLHVYRVLMELTKLRGDRRDARIGQIVKALRLASPELAAVRKRFERIPTDMWLSLPAGIRPRKKAKSLDSDPPRSR